MLKYYSLFSPIQINVTMAMCSSPDFINSSALLFEASEFKQKLSMRKLSEQVGVTDAIGTSTIGTSRNEIVSIGTVEKDLKRTRIEGSKDNVIDALASRQTIRRTAQTDGLFDPTDPDEIWDRASQ